MSGKTKHTPGPWVVGLTIGSPHVSPEGPWGWYQTDIEGPQGEGCFLELRQYHGGETRDANARLIAAAPEMLEMLRDVLPILEAVDDGAQANGDLPLLLALKEVIWKATGEES